MSSTWNGVDDRLRGAAPDRWSNSIGLSMTVPLQQLPERNALASSQISLQRAERAYRETMDQLELDIRDQIRALHTQEQQVILQESQIVQETRAVRVSKIRYESGDLENRDLLEARQSLVDAQNQLISLKVSHFIGRLQLLRSLGVLFIDEQGGW